MESHHLPSVWLAYVSHPLTAAVYFERALRQKCRVVTCGPKLGPDFIEKWQLQNMKLPVVDLDLSVPYEPNMREILSAARDRFPLPDMYLWVESVPGYRPKQLETLRCPKACYLIYSHLDLDGHIEWARFFDFVFVAQREYVPAFRRQGCNNVHWLPVACDPEVHARKTSDKIFDVGFVGTVFQKSRRADLLTRMAARNFLVRMERCFGDEMARLYSQSRIAFNNAVRNDLNMRVFEAMSVGTFLLTDPARNSGQDELFVEGEDLGIYRDDDLTEKVRYFLIHEEEREEIARRGQFMAHQAHTYSHRCEELLRVCLYGQGSTPTAGEWRERSLAGVDILNQQRRTAHSRPNGRSFIIPVLHAFDAAKTDFESLLTDLQKIEGEVIVIFNSAEAAAAFKNHPRIDHWASLNINAGVPRAWNIGVHLSTQPTLFFLNADLRVERNAIETLEQALWKLPAAAVVGPEGSFVRFDSGGVFVRFAKGTVGPARYVDDISGFFFAVKRELFSRKILQFENEYTPCFFEEWDLGLQVRQAGYRCYVVPTTGYDHAWGISAQPDKIIRYLKNEQTSTKILQARNRTKFWRKWLSAAGELALPSWESNGPESTEMSGSSLLRSHYVQATGDSNHAGHVSSVGSEKPGAHPG